MQHAIETVHNGFRFRSRLEARWCCFFESLGLDYRYEPEAFDLGPLGPYLPDFWLTGLGCWLEVKPTEAEAWGAQEKVSALAMLTHQPAFILYGDAWETARAISIVSGAGVVFDGAHQWGECASCEKVYLVPDEREWFCPCQESTPPIQAQTTRLLTAYTAARSARFDGWWRNRTGSDLQPRRIR